VLRDYILKIENLKKLCVEYTEDQLEELKNAAAEDDKNFSPAMIKLIEVKDTLSMFKSLSELDIKKVIKDISFKKFKKGEIVLREGEVSEEIYYIVTGNCNVVVGRKIVGKLTGQQLFGEIASLTKQPRSATVRSTTDTMTIVFKLAFKEVDLYPYAFAILFRNFTLELVRKLDSVNKK
jgi:CRP-like cAMP-binding protein